MILEKLKNLNLTLPVSRNREEDWWYWWECLVLPWCFSDWDTEKDYEKNMWDAIYSFLEWLDEWFFDVSNIWFINFNIKNGKISSNFVKKVNWNSAKELSYN